MKLTRRPLFTILLIGITMIAWIITIGYMRHNSTRSAAPLCVSLTKDQYAKDEPVTINVLFTNPLRQQIWICQSSFGLAEHRGEEGLYINDDQLRHKCRGHYISDIGFICGLELLKLKPRDTVNETITIPAEAAFTPGPHEISYQLRIPFYGNEKQFGLAPGETITVYLDPRDRPILDKWKDHVHYFINGNGEFTVRGKLEFVVK